MDPEKIGTWARAGLKRARIGCESGAQKILDRMSKFTTTELLAKSIRLLAEGGVRTTTYWIGGFPGETEEDFEMTMDFVREHHESIYEAEAHVYQPHKHGSVMSGENGMEYCPAYPDDVNRFTRFIVWEIKDARPCREEGFRRVSRLMGLTQELGIPNIYNLSDLMRAETRWQRLHPAARA